MSRQLIELVPNFSEGRRQEVIDQILNALRNASDAKILDSRADPDHNRLVVTMVGSPQACFDSAFAGIKKASELIDMDEHEGEHPRIGATDVVPFVPISGITLEECSEYAVKLAKKVSEEIGIPTYLYEASATRPDRVNLAKIRKGQYEVLKEAIETDPNRTPDFGPSKMPKAGATVIGAREFLIAYNIYLNTDDIAVAKKIGANIRHKNGGFHYVKSMGFETKPYVQVSMNLTNFRQTPMHMVLETVRREAARYGYAIRETEVYGMIPMDALLQASEFYLQLNDKWDPQQVIEKKMMEIPKQNLLQEIKVREFIEELASDAPAPGGGSVACVNGAMAAGLGAKVSRLTIGKKKYAEVEELFQKNLPELDKLHEELTNLIDEDANAFNGVMAAFKLPKGTEEEKIARANKIQEEYKVAASVPMKTVRACKKVLDILLELGTKGNTSTASDMAVAALNALIGLRSAAMNVEINLPSIKDEKFRNNAKSELTELMAGLEEAVHALIKSAKSKF
jgi:glutamate formiminotransferase/formiminotetrahydrofolate cyclodeaminase